MASLTDGVEPSRGGYFAGDLGVGDLNGDGFADIVATAFSSTLVTHWLRCFDGGAMGPEASPSRSMTLNALSVPSYGAGQVAVGDYDGDGRSDVTLLRQGADVYLSRSGREWLALNRSITTLEGEWFSSVVGSR